MRFAISTRISSSSLVPERDCIPLPSDTEHKALMPGVTTSNGPVTLLLQRKGLQNSILGLEPAFETRTSSD